MKRRVSMLFGRSRAEFRGRTRSKEDVREFILAWLAESMGVARGEIGLDTDLVDYGLDSIMAMNLSCRLEEYLDRPVPATLVWQHPTIDGIAKHMAGQASA